MLPTSSRWKTGRSRRARTRSIPRYSPIAGATFFTPHLGSAVDEVRRAIAVKAAENVLDVVCGRRPRSAINQPRVARPALSPLA